MKLVSKRDAQTSVAAGNPTNAVRIAGQRNASAGSEHEGRNLEMTARHASKRPHDLFILLDSDRM